MMLQDETDVEQQEITSDEVGDVGEILEEHAEADAATQEVITDINELDMAVEPAEAPDLDELEERMTYAPSIPPGFHPFRFALDPEQPIQSVVMAGKTCLQLNFKLTLLNDDGSEGKTINFVRANNMRTGKMTASRLDELFMALSEDRDLAEKWLETDRKAKAALAIATEAEELGRGVRGRVIWRSYDKATGETLSTSPSKPYKSKKTGLMVVEKPWPRDAQGRLERHPGNEEVTGWLPLKLPEPKEATKK